jgi:hypothetical protein
MFVNDTSRGALISALSMRGSPLWCHQLFSTNPACAESLGMLVFSISDCLKPGFSRPVCHAPSGGSSHERIAHQRRTSDHEKPYDAGPSRLPTVSKHSKQQCQERRPAGFYTSLSVWDWPRLPRRQLFRVPINRTFNNL